MDAAASLLTAEPATPRRARTIADAAWRRLGLLLTLFAAIVVVQFAPAQGDESDSTSPAAGETAGADDAGPVRFAGRTAEGWRNHFKELTLSGPEAQQEVPQLLELAGDEAAPALLRRQAVHTLGRIGEPARDAIPLLESMLAETEVTATGEPPRVWALRGFALMGRPARAATPALVEILNSADEPHLHRLLALEAVGQIGPTHPQALPALARALDSSPSGPDQQTARETLELRIAAADFLSQFGASAAPALPALLRAARDKDEPLRRTAVATLGTTGDVLALHGLVDVLLFDESPAVQDAAAVSLAALGAPAVPALQQLLEDEDAAIRWRVVDALGRIGAAAKPAARALSALENDPDPRVRLEVAKALWAVTSEVEPAASIAIPLFAAADRDHRIGAHRILVSILSKSKDETLRARLEDLASSRDPRIRQAALQTLREAALTLNP